MSIYSSIFHVKVCTKYRQPRGGTIRKQSYISKYQYPGADPGFQVRGEVHLKKLHRAEGGAKHFGLFRVKNHIFSNFRGGRGTPGIPPWIRPWYHIYVCSRGGCHGLDHMVVGFTNTMPSVPITTNVVSSYPAQGTMYSIQHYVIRWC